MEFDAIILAGGRSQRLGGRDKSALWLDGSTLLERACHAVSGANRVVVVGAPVESLAGVEFVREEPAFGGPAAGIGAGVNALGADAAELVAILGCDLPHADRAMPVLLAAAAKGFDADAVVAADDSGYRQTLLGLYRLGPLRAAVGSGQLTSVAVRKLFGRLRFIELPVPVGSTRDVDTWQDAQELGVRSRDGSLGPGTPGSRIGVPDHE